MRFAAVALAAGLLLFPVRAQEASIADFQGQWVGQVSVETYDDPENPASVRESGVTVTPLDGGGFKLEWSTAETAASSADAPADEGHAEAADKVRGGEVTFKPIAPGRWAGDPTGAPIEGKAEWFARFEGATLVVVSFNLLDTGKAEMQTFRRTIAEGAMALSYTRVTDGVVVRRASGALAKFAAP